MPNVIQPLDPRDAINYGTPAPLGVPIESGDQLTLMYSSDTAGETLIIQARIQLQTGQIIVWAQHAITVAGANNAVSWPMTPGILLSLNIFNNTVTSREIVIHAQIHLHYQSFLNGPMLTLLVSGYIDGGSTLSYPTSPVVAALNETPRQQHVSFGAPAAGAQYGYRSMANAWEMLRSIYFTFTADANVATRDFYLEVLDASAVLMCQYPFGNTVTAGNSFSHTFALDGTYRAAGSPRYPIDRLPAIWMPPYGQWRIEVGNLQVGDQLSVANAIVDIKHVV